MSLFARDLPFGATVLDDGRTRFRLWAPSQQNVSLEIEDGGTPVTMRGDAGGWFETEVACRPGTLYRYRLGSGVAVPDPAARAQAADVHGPSQVVDPRAYRWRNTTWRGRPWTETVLYELHAGLLGGFAGVAAGLSKLQNIGITAVELMPVNDFPGNRNWGYDGVLPFAPDRAYGSPDDLKALQSLRSRWELSRKLCAAFLPGGFIDALGACNRLSP
jgi:1,4-alpha-glucan branching enzyme